MEWQTRQDPLDRSAYLPPSLKPPSGNNYSRKTVHSLPILWTHTWLWVQGKMMRHWQHLTWASHVSIVLDRSGSLRQWPELGNLSLPFDYHSSTMFHSNTIGVPKIKWNQCDAKTQKNVEDGVWLAVTCSKVVAIVCSGSTAAASSEHMVTQEHFPLFCSWARIWWALWLLSIIHSGGPSPVLLNVIPWPTEEH